jgi:hypothetical protein
MFDQSRRYIIIGISIVRLQSLMEILRNALRPLRKHLLIFIGLEIEIKQTA